MEASRHNRSSSPAVVGGRSAVAPGGTLSAVGRLIERADALHLRAPELALVLGERAAALAESAGADEQWIRAESLVVSARVRIGSRPSTVGRAVAALRAAEHAGYGDIAARLRIDLAVCARSLGTPLTGIAALRPVLSDPVVSPVHRAEALCHLVGCLAQFGRKAELDRVLVEADRLVQHDDSLDSDTRLLVRALLRNGTAAHRRRHGDLTAAADAARTGLGFLEKMDRPEDDGGLVRVRLVLQLVSTLLDRGDAEMALEIAQPTLAEPVRAAGSRPRAGSGWPWRPGSTCPPARAKRRRNSCARPSRAPSGTACTPSPRGCGSSFRRSRNASAGRKRPSRACTVRAPRSTCTHVLGGRPAVCSRANSARTPSRPSTSTTCWPRRRRARCRSRWNPCGTTTPRRSCGRPS